ncbi:excinuclease ABC subunit C [Hanamia caeni]|uniref:UvrABC system protein C n=1 Tax=Hanamia caeni TaxID=2294116 RepID=A0A3M9NEH2_9BACT|nr:excinuclease ABC subunit UvrC [Hanamia caeni]RNI36184.1 excinuclease ABC subunit C [Hanamia caeni]
MTAEIFQTIIKTLPNNPGIYKYFDEANELIYVGKAKNIRKRVSSYFTKTFTGYKTHELVRRIGHIEFTIVDSEQDAFLLENSLIKQFQPKFNINLKDDKSYPYIVIKNEPFPRIFLTRNKINDGSQYLGPFTSVGRVRELLSFIKEFIPLRTCKLNLTESNILRQKFKVCLEYHLGNCKGPCEGLQSKEDYEEGLQQVKQIIKGNLAPVIQRYREEMNYYSEQLQFEKAAVIKKKIEGLENYQARSVVVSKSISNVDVFSILREKNTAYINYLMVQNGTIIQTHTITLEPKLDETDEEILSLAITDLRQKFSSEATEIVIPFEIDFTGEGISVTVPKAGDKKKLLDLSEKNVNYFMAEMKRKKMLRLEGKTGEEKTQVLNQLKNDLHLPAFPAQIECFDNSNFQGSFPVAAMVFFRNGLPDKNEYRRFNIKTVTGINDFASMKEVVTRRYKRLLRDDLPLPQLIIIDGGKGQLNAAVEGLHEIGMTGKTTVVGLAKNEEEIFFPGDTESIKLPWDSESLKLIRRIRDEVHRFGITFHRNQRSRGTFVNELEMIKGIGKNTADNLLKRFKSVKKIKDLSQNDLEEAIGKPRAQIVYQYFHPDEENESGEPNV